MEIRQPPRSANVSRDALALSARANFGHDRTSEARTPEAGCQNRRVQESPTNRGRRMWNRAGAPRRPCRASLALSTSPTWLLADGRSAWLIVESTADEEMTRRSIALDRASLAALPIAKSCRRVNPSRALTVKLFGTMNDYFAYIQVWRVCGPCKTRSVFIAEKNILSGWQRVGRTTSLQMAAFRKHCCDVRQELAANAGRCNAGGQLERHCVRTVDGCRLHSSTEIRRIAASGPSALDARQSKDDRATAQGL